MVFQFNMKLKSVVSDNGLTGLYDSLNYNPNILHVDINLISSYTHVSSVQISNEASLYLQTTSGKSKW